MKLSVCIPYKARLDNLRIALEALAHQTMDSSEFEVVIGAMEYTTDLTELCAEFDGRLDIVTVNSSREFHIPLARNLAMRSATGEVVVQMDADTLLPPPALRELYDRHFAFGQQICVIGQVVGYANNEDGQVETVELRSYGDHLAALEELASAPGWPADPRFQVPHNIPWAFAWTGLIAVPRAAVVARDLYFDETFRGWGVDDLEWGFRVCASGLPITLSPQVYALHLPHTRDALANQRTEERNYERFLAKWPRRDVELCRFIGDTRANSAWPQYLEALAAAGGAATLGVAVGTVKGERSARFGVPLDRAGKPLDDGYTTGFDAPENVTVLPLTGLSTPFRTEEFATVWLEESLQRLPEPYRSGVVTEVKRVTRSGA
ncbi:glycosyltransferase family 2 protein [Streptomyces antimicrobicus]|uniref:Glycosyltransferase n=1 Tax=Streptomyces antimicrobicus TaxID=2883108 RepID=A0ABS8B0W5_9ACTN|nr:glycosyltransferase family 2 protein [Streptomyces antimicrobicus]MCB5178237.1 glycosyltransferase [Streptomyces antimicrobicus]